MIHLHSHARVTNVTAADAATPEDPNGEFLGCFSAILLGLFFAGLTLALGAL